MMVRGSHVLTVFTTAPEEYDYGSTEVLDEDVCEVRGFGLADGTVRLVRCNLNQRERYRSGGFLVSEDDPRNKELAT